MDPRSNRLSTPLAAVDSPDLSSARQRTITTMHEAASRVWTFHRAGAQRYVTFAEHLRRQPSILTRILLIAAAIVIAVPLALVAIFVTAVLLLFVAVILVIHAVRGWLARLWPGRDGRSNVRVIRRVE